jgi:hypothetical protein
MIKIAEISKYVTAALDAHGIDEALVQAIRWGHDEIEVSLYEDACLVVKGLPLAEKGVLFECSGRHLQAWDARSVITGVSFFSYEEELKP